MTSKQMKNKTKKTTEDIKKAVAEGKYPLDFSHCYFEENANLHDVVFAGDVNFYYAEFMRDASFGGAKFYGNTSFAAAEFHYNAAFRGATFKGEANFTLAKFAGNANFDSADFEKYASFIHAKFAGYADFFEAKFAGYTVFDEVKFAGDADFSQAKFEKGAHFNQAKFLKEVNFTKFTFGQEVNLSFDKAVFVGVTTFDVSAPELKKLSMDHAIFEAPTIIHLPVKTCPDFSKSRFLKTVIIEETWTEKSIEDEFKEAKRGGGEPDESFKTLEGKFRFLKTYFAKSGNHFKEIEYFKYEMRAWEGGLKAKKEVKGWCEHVRRRGEFVLFWLYKILSNYGTSVFRPLLGLASSLVLFTLVSYFSSLDGVSAAFAENFSRTIFPLSEFPLSELKNSSSVPSVWETIQALINVTFLFLLALGLRNKFKIK